MLWALCLGHWAHIQVTFKCILATCIGGCIDPCPAWVMSKLRLLHVHAHDILQLCVQLCESECLCASQHLANAKYLKL